LARLGPKSLSYYKSEELHDKVNGHDLNIKHYQYIRFMPQRLLAKKFR
ncbi:IS1 family transposase, partial [Escherichia coli]|nr:IS1 family transposase [Escherichia coli]